jgi:FG-GAP repeat
MRPAARSSALLLVLTGVALTLGIDAAAATPALSFAAPKSYASGKYPNAVALGDLNNDGKLDIAVANTNSANVSILLQGDGGLQPKHDYRTGLNRSP